MPSTLREDAHIRFIRTPRYLWPFNSAASAFWPPLGFCSLAAEVRQRFPNLRVSILDCPALRIGWQTLENHLLADPPDVVCIGEETVSAPEGLRLAGLARQLHPKTIIIAGGVYFGSAAAETFAHAPVDFIVSGEGEATLVELIRSLIEGKSPAGIRGLAWPEDGGIRVNPSSEPIADMDTLPMPAYDLLDVDAYGRGSRNHPAPASLEQSRGCTARCSFCILWKHFGRPENGSVAPFRRAKSPERMFEEVKRLAAEYGRRTIHFVDPTFNADPAWIDRFTDLMLASPPGVKFTAWMRADCVVRDEELGLMEKLVRAGLVQAYVGIERAEQADLDRLNRRHSGPAVAHKAFEILRTRYPEVFSIGTVIYGLPWETRETLAALRALRRTIAADYIFYIPLTPNPGTDIRAEVRAQGRGMSDNLREYNFLTPVADTERLSRDDLEDFYSDLVLSYPWDRLRTDRQALLRIGDARAQRVHRNLLWYSVEVGGRQLARRLLRPFTGGRTLYCRKPAWYDS